MTSLSDRHFFTTDPTYRVPHIGTEYYRVPHIGTEYYRVPHIGTDYCRVPHIGTDYCRVPHIGTDYCRVPHLGTNYYMVPHIGTNYYRVPHIGTNSRLCTAVVDVKKKLSGGLRERLWRTSLFFRLNVNFINSNSLSVSSTKSLIKWNLLLLRFATDSDTVVWGVTLFWPVGRYWHCGGHSYSHFRFMAACIADLYQ